MSTPGVSHKRLDFDAYFPLDDSDHGNNDRTATDTSKRDYASLPFPAPLNSLRAYFRDNAFECDGFLLQHQKHSQLDDLLVELRNLSGLLDAQLVQSIEDDYEAFIGLGRLDARHVCQLERSMLQVTQQLREYALAAQASLTVTQETLRARRALRKRTLAARDVVRLAMAIDEISFFLLAEGKDDGGNTLGALEALECCAALSRKTEVPEYEAERLRQLISTLHDKLSLLVSSAKGEEKLEYAIFMRRFQACCVVWR